ncbi:hybrid sensor histidine kinase/response regulator [Phanerochaete sordida]|uniref:histidine kinase n=1 Tax=Phanerochaete sordida TaxID=48140 RepID=A0A9P3GFD4_9APHY|nr:hybrid sensor histidine kinase/response regulator [Phanerochaete sordida]
MTAVPHYSTRTSSTYDGLSVPSKPHVEKLDVNTDESVLPPPVVQFSPTNRSSGKRKQRARIKESTAQVLRAQWDRLLRKFGTGTAPSASSIDLDAESDRERTSTVGHYNPEWKRFEAAEEIDEVVVEREWGEDIKASSVHSGHGGEKSGSGPPGHASGEDAESVAVSHNDGRCNSPVYAYFRYRIWAAIKSFFATEFIDEKSEEQYRKETWFMRKNLALWSAGFFILNWLLSCVFVPKPITLADKIFHYGIAPAFTFPILFMVLWDFPRDRNWIYQIVLMFATWMWGVFQILVMYLCAYYGGHRPFMSCGTKDFLATFYYANAPQTIALFGLGLHRFPALVGTLTFMALSFGMIVPDRTTWVRNVINFLCFQAFLLYLHYMRENSERRLYTLRDQLKVQFRATQKAQVNERKAADSKRRLTSYVFHEVRVPLNTALLAVQNMAASGAVAKGQEIEFKALEGSLSMMSKVLNDVLDFNRMDSGRFESVSRPYPFHKVMRSLFVPLRMATDARSLSFVTELDKGIDDIARRLLYEAQGMSELEALKKVAENPDEDGIVVGDETRLRQIVTNLASNACKFTPAGGQLTITTRLVLPHSTLPSRQDSETLTASDGSKDLKEAVNGSPASNFKELGVSEKLPHPQLSYKHLEKHNSLHSKPPPIENIVVRIEITDTGCGIRPIDMVQCKLFSAFNQTEMGRQQGGKGTGLGLALVRQIVKLSGGRLGVQSKVGKGSTFWVELPLGVGSKAVPFLTTPQFYPQTERVGHSGPGDYVHDHLNVGSAESRWSQRLPQRGHLPRMQSAMHTIMDQGGLVEISTDSRTQGQVLTRTLGDSSTGTDPTPTVPLTTPECSPALEHPHPPLTFEQPSDTTVRPTFVQLPAPQRFSLEQLERFLDAPGSNAGTPVGTPSGSAHSSAGGWEMGMRVLVVDDDPLTRKLMTRMLTRLGCKVSTAENGEIALELILGTFCGTRATPSSEETGSGGLSDEALSAGGPPEEYKYAVVFLDNQMPVLSGLDTVARLREMGRHDFVVGVTGNALLSDQQEYLEAGVDRVLTKPVYEKSLKNVLAYADERRRRGYTPTTEPPDPSALP